MRKFIPIVMVAAFHASGANIITFGDNANRCGGAVMCSTNGTSGYLINGTGQAFDLSTFSNWFQIDPGGTNMLTATQTEAEPNGGAGSFLVMNDTGSLVTTFSIVISDSFTASTPSVTFCAGSPGPLCDNFQANKGALTGTSESLSGPNFYSCTNGTQVGQTCTSNAGQAAANFTPGNVTYTWNGLNIAPGEKFDISFASWQSGNSAFTGGASVQAVPEPSIQGLSAAGLCGLIALAARRRRTRLK